MSTKIDWYARRYDLQSGQRFLLNDGSVCELDRPVPGDGTDWYAADWWGNSFAYMDSRIHPSDLAERLADDYAPAST